MALSATLAIQNEPGSAVIVKNTCAHAVLTLSNHSSQAVTVYTISQWASGSAGGPAYAQQDCQRCPLTVPGGSTITVPINYVLPLAQTFGSYIAAVDLSFICGVTVYSNDNKVGVLSLITSLLMTQPQDFLVVPSTSQSITPVAAGR